MYKSPYEAYPHVEAEEVIIRKIVSSDLDRLYEIYSNENLFRHSPMMLKKNKETVANMIGHFERDFNKHKMIMLGIAFRKTPDDLVGTFELFDYNKVVNMITVGYRLNEQFWGQGIVSKAVQAMTDYLFNCIGINRIQAFVMPENIKSQNVLIRNGFTVEGTIRQGTVWKGHGVVDLILFSRLRADEFD
ncbi:GNAT family N-acetyltransferase [Fusibacter sp. Q10-2]|uniref:GNAT family N-acetyltransferase n=1 Tax=Fusibacter ferrireducens TaxID=2785058 RepID=A0ABR9ZQ46_9FIRM|nr:GNAT family N-acetyltransferase [Fusibacter ferrireducens]